MTNHVVALIAKKYQKVREEVEGIMRGKILEYEAKTIRNEVTKEVTEKVTRELASKFVSEVTAKAEDQAKDMLHDRMELSRIEKYTHLPMPRIQELARGLGMA